MWENVWNMKTLHGQVKATDTLQIYIRHWFQALSIKQITSSPVVVRWLHLHLEIIHQMCIMQNKCELMNSDFHLVITCAGKREQPSCEQLIMECICSSSPPLL